MGKYQKRPIFGVIRHLQTVRKSLFELVYLKNNNKISTRNNKHLDSVLCEGVEQHCSFKFAGYSMNDLAVVSISYKTFEILNCIKGF